MPSLKAEIETSLAMLQSLQANVWIFSLFVLLKKNLQNLSTAGMFLPVIKSAVNSQGRCSFYTKTN